MRGPVTQPAGNARQRDGHDTQQNRAAHAPNHQDRDEQKTGGGEKKLWVGSFAEADESSGIGDDDFRISQTDERDEQTNAGGRAMFQAIGNVVDDVLADVGKSKHEEEQAGQKDHTKGGWRG